MTRTTGGPYNRDIHTRRWGKRNQELTSTNQVDQGGVDISLVTPSPLTAYTTQRLRVQIQSRHKMQFFLVYSGDYNRGSRSVTATIDLLFHCRTEK